MPETIRSLSRSRMIAPATCSRATGLLNGVGLRSERVNARKIPRLLWLGLLALGLASRAAAQTPDTTQVFRTARRAESDYEGSIRRFAPFLSRASAGGVCDEVIGRYCLTYDVEHYELPAEPRVISEARDHAISALGAAAAIAPGRPAIVYPLVRFLVRAGRADHAVPIAQAYARTREGSPDGAMVLAYALHEARRTEDALHAFETWLGGLPVRERARIESLEWVSAAALMETDRVWRYADPLYITPGNELRSEHLARHALSRMLKQRRVSAAGSWGSDDEQLTIRYGYPYLSTRSHRSGSMGMNETLSDHWNPSQRTYIPPRLDSALAMPARVDTIWPLDSLMSRSSHTPPTIRTMHVLEHQAFRFGDSLRITGVVRTDSLTKGPMLATVFLLDSALNEVAAVTESPCHRCLVGDSALLDLRLAVPGTARFYSAELYDPVSRFAARARYRLDPAAASSTIALSGLRIEASRPVVEVGTRPGLYAELTNRTAERRTARVELETRLLDRPSAMVRAAGWVGEKLGVSTRQTPARLSWEVEIDAGHTTPLPLTLGMGDAVPGRYRLTLRVVESAGVNVVSRDFLVISGGSSSRRP
jgi:hypothetical protein